MTDLSPAAVVDRRLDALRALADEPASTATLVDRLGVSRSTVDRSLYELRTVGFVAPAADGNRVTTLGRLALAEHDRLTRRIDALADAADLFGDVAVDVDPAVFDGASVVVAGPHAPHRPVERLASLVERATHVCVYTTRYLSRNVDLYYDRVVDGMTGEFVSTEAVIRRVAETRPDDLRETFDLGRVAIRRTDRDDPLTLALAETPSGPEMGLVAYRGDVPGGFVGTDDPAATRWARSFHERLWASATPFEP